MEGFDEKDPERWFRERAQTGQIGMPPSFPPPEEASAEAKARVTNILSNYGLLGQNLDRHEAVIRKRWLKKTKMYQRSIPIEAWPNMAPCHGPGFKVL